MQLTANLIQMKRALEMFEPLSGDGLMRLSPEGMRIQLTDTTGSVCLDMKAPANSFINYTCTEDRTICVDLANLRNSLSRPQDDDVLLMFLLEGSNEIRFHIRKREGTKIVRDRMFHIPLVSNEGKVIKDFEFKHESWMRISSKLFRTAIGDMASSLSSKKIGGSVSIEVSDKKIKFFSGSKEGVKTKVEYYKSELSGIQLKDNIPITMLLGLKIISNVFKPMSDDLMFKFYLDEKKPIRCDFDIADLRLNTMSNTSAFSFSLLIAPVIMLADDVTDSQSDEEGGLEVGDDFAIPELDIAKDKLEVKK